MTSRYSRWGFLFPALLFLVGGVLVGGGCEPYMSMTDRMPAEARQATALLPEHPRFVGMVDVQTVLNRLNETRRINLSDSLRQVDHPRLRTFFETTDLDPRADLRTVYAAVGPDNGFSALVVGSVRPEQIRRYLDQAPEGAGQATTYRDLPLFELTFEKGECENGPETVALAFLGNDMVAVSSTVDRVEAMVDRHHNQQSGLAENQDYMRLMERVGRGSTAWVVGRDMLERALQDTADAGTMTASVNQAGVQEVLADWSNRVLGLSEVPDVEGGTRSRLERLNRRIREEAVSLTWVDETIDGEIYLTMRDDASASSVVQVAEGALAAFRLSRDDLTARQRDLLDEIDIQRDGPLVHVSFSLDQTFLRRDA